MPRSNRDRLAGGRHTEPAEERAIIQRAAEVTADKLAQPKPARIQASTAPVPTTTRQTLTGNSPGPVWGDVIGPVPNAVYQIVFHVTEQSAPAVRFELRAAMKPDVDWETNSAVLDSAGMWLKPAITQLYKEETIINPGRGATRLTRRIPVAGTPPPRWPQYVRPVMFPSTRKPMTAKVEVELRRDDE